MEPIVEMVTKRIMELIEDANAERHSPRIIPESISFGSISRIVETVFLVGWQKGLNWQRGEKKQPPLSSWGMDDA